jgi:hypothetical protein
MRVPVCEELLPVLGVYDWDLHGRKAVSARLRAADAHIVFFPEVLFDRSAEELSGLLIDAGFSLSLELLLQGLAAERSPGLRLAEAGGPALLVLQDLRAVAGEPPLAVLGSVLGSVAGVPW